MSAGRITLALVLVAALTVPAPADARSKPRADLVVSSAAFTPSGSSLAGKFTVRNAGLRSAAKSKAALNAVTTKKTTTLKRFNVSALKRGKKG